MIWPRKGRIPVSLLLKLVLVVSIAKSVLASVGSLVRFKPYHVRDILSALSPILVEFENRRPRDCAQYQSLGFGETNSKHETANGTAPFRSCVPATPHKEHFLLMDSAARGCPLGQPCGIEGLLAIQEPEIEGAFKTVETISF